VVTPSGGAKKKFRRAGKKCYNDIAPLQHPRKDKYNSLK